MTINQLFITSILLTLVSINSHAWWADSSSSPDKNESVQNPINVNQIQIQQKMNVEQYQAYQQYIKEIEAIQKAYRQQTEAARKAYNKDMQQWYIR